MTTETDGPSDRDHMILETPTPPKFAAFRGRIRLGRSGASLEGMDWMQLYLSHEPHEPTQPQTLTHEVRRVEYYSP
jgi:hypothetical protein